MKKLLALILVMLVLVSMVACSKAPDNGTEGSSTKAPTATTEPAATTEATEPATEATVDVNNWGAEDSIPTDDGEKIQFYSIRVPKYTGSYYMHSKISEQLDDTVVLIAGQHMDGPKGEEISNIFSAYTNNTLQSLEALYGIQSSNFKLSIDSSEAVTIGDYDMYVHTGVITYDFDGTQRQHQYVAYATKLKDSGNCAYWMVYDFSADQSKGDLIAEHALNMAKSFREQK